MTRTLIYVIAAFALWLYFKYGTFGGSFSGGRTEGGGGRTGGGGSSGGAGASRGYTVNPFNDSARSGYGGGRMV